MFKFAKVIIMNIAVKKNSRNFTLNVYRKSYILQRSNYSSNTSVSVSVSVNVNEGRTLTGTLIY